MLLLWLKWRYRQILKKRGHITLRKGTQSSSSWSPKKHRSSIGWSWFSTWNLRLEEHFSGKGLVYLKQHSCNTFIISRGTFASLEHKKRNYFLSPKGFIWMSTSHNFKYRSYSCQGEPMGYHSQHSKYMWLRVHRGIPFMRSTLHYATSLLFLLSPMCMIHFLTFTFRSPICALWVRLSS